MTILGIDPSSKFTGYAIITDEKLIDYGVLKLKDKLLSVRLGELYRYFDEIFFKNDIDIVVVENQFVGNKNSVLSLSKSQGVILSCSGTNQIDVMSYYPTEIKKAITSKGNATKKEVADSLKEIYPQLNELPFIEKGTKKTDDIFDAIAIALTYFKSPNGKLT